MPAAAPLLSSTYELEDGLRARLRLSRPSDAPRVRAFMERLSPATLERRFLSPMPAVPERVIRHFTFYDPRERLVVAATTPHTGGEAIVGLADVRLRDTGVAELGVVVDDARQGQGVGRLLAETVAALAVRHGATHLKAEMLDGNAAMLNLMRSLGRTVERVEDGTSVAYTKLGREHLRAA